MSQKESESNEYVLNCTSDNTCPTKIKLAFESGYERAIQINETILIDFMRWYWAEIDGKPYKTTAEELIKSYLE